MAHQVSVTGQLRGGPHKGGFVNVPSKFRKHPRGKKTIHSADESLRRAENLPSAILGGMVFGTMEEALIEARKSGKFIDKGRSRKFK